MHAPLEDYALVGDCHGAGLVSRDGSVDWLCIPRFDSGACFAALLGTPEHGRWRLGPRAAVKATRRRYRENTLTLETELETEEGTIRIVDSMPVESRSVDLVRLVEGVSGKVCVEMDLAVRFGYGRIAPWLTCHGGELEAVAGPDKLHLRTPVVVEVRDRRASACFDVSAGQRLPFVLTYHPSHVQNFERIEPFQAIDATDAWWRRWTGRTPDHDERSDAVKRSLIVLKALTYLPTGGLVAAPTTSLPEFIGGSRNWDYRYCWLRDATITLSTLLNAGYEEEARAWREWLLRAIAGDPAEVRVMYGVMGERYLPERELDWLSGYEGSKPVRSGNAACSQLQLDIYGELMNTMHQCRRRGFENRDSWALELALLDHLEGRWREPDHGIWEMRGRPEQFVHSKMMCWVAFDRAVRAVRQFGREGPLERWEKQRDMIHREVCQYGYNSTLGSFTQVYGGSEVDASLLMMALVGFLPPEDARVRGTVHQIQAKLSHGGLLRRYNTEGGRDGIDCDEACFLPCSFWLVENLALLGEYGEAWALFDKLISLGNDVGLLSEEYDVERQRLTGNFPQAFTHLALVDSAYRLRKHDPLGLEANGDGESRGPEP